MCGSLGLTACCSVGHDALTGNTGLQRSDLEYRMTASTIVFDFDGTLHDSLYIYRIALQRGYDWLAEQGKVPAREFSDDYIAANIGLTVQDAWKRMCPSVPWSVTGEAARRVGAIMNDLIYDGTARLYPGVTQMLEQLKESGHELVFLSNCRTAYLVAVRTSFGFDRWFSHYYAAEQYGEAPKEQIFEIIRSEVPGPYIVVGDRDKDRLLAEAHGLPFVGCLYGYGISEELAGATWLVDDPLEIVDAIASIEAKM